MRGFSVQLARVDSVAPAGGEGGCLLLLLLVVNDISFGMSQLYLDIYVSD